jgi:hypothetical protein
MWQTMDTAPKDGRLILLYAPQSIGPHVHEAWWWDPPNKDRPGYWATQPVGPENYGKGWHVPLNTSFAVWIPLPSLLQGENPGKQDTTG